MISEMPLGAGPWRWTFPARNRIVAALSGMTVVVEAARRSGALITADLAAGLGRDLGAVPGPVNSSGSAGTNDLLAGGACVVREAQDVLDAMLGAGITRVCPTGAAEQARRGGSRRIGRRGAERRGDRQRGRPSERGCRSEPGRSHRLGLRRLPPGLPLQEWQIERIDAGAGPSSIGKTQIVLGSIFKRLCCRTNTSTAARRPSSMRLATRKSLTAG